jgi:hypothetical protein
MRRSNYIINNARNRRRRNYSINNARNRRTLNRHLSKILATDFSRVGMATPRECIQILLDGYNNPTKALKKFKEIAEDQDRCQVGTWTNLESYIERIQSTEDGIIIHPRVEGGKTKVLIADTAHRCIERVSARDRTLFTPPIKVKTQVKREIKSEIGGSRLASISMMPFSKSFIRSSSYKQLLPINSFLPAGSQKSRNSLPVLVLIPFMLAGIFSAIKDRFQKK